MVRVRVLVLTTTLVEYTATSSSKTAVCTELRYSDLVEWRRSGEYPTTDKGLYSKIFRLMNATRTIRALLYTFDDLEVESPHECTTSDHDIESDNVKRLYISGKSRREYYEGTPLPLLREIKTTVPLKVRAPLDYLNFKSICMGDVDITNVSKVKFNLGPENPAINLIGLNERQTFKLSIPDSKVTIPVPYEQVTDLSVSHTSCHDIATMGDFLSKFTNLKCLKLPNYLGLEIELPSVEAIFLHDNHCLFDSEKFPNLREVEVSAKGINRHYYPHITGAVDKLRIRGPEPHIFAPIKIGGIREFDIYNIEVTDYASEKPLRGLFYVVPIIISESTESIKLATGSYTSDRVEVEINRKRHLTKAVKVG